MKKIISISLLFLCIFLYSDQTTYTIDGRKVLLRDNGTWEYVQEQLNKWDVNDKIDPLDDSRILIFLLQADTGKGKFNDPVYLVIRYNKKDEREIWDVYIVWNSYLSDDGQEVFYRFDDGDAEMEESSVSNNNKATFFRNPEAIVQKLLSSKKLVVRTTPYSENSVTSVFDTTGLQELFNKYSLKIDTKDTN